MTTLNVQQLQLLHQVQSHSIPFLNALYLGLVLKLPFIPLDSKLRLYGLLTSPSAAFLATSKLPPVVLVMIVGFYPLLSLVVVCFIGYVVVQLIFLVLSGIRYGMGRFQKIQPKIFLELTFPDDTTKSAYATKELYRLMHTLSRQKSFWERILLRKKGYSLEIVSTKNEGIRYLLAAESGVIETIQYNLRSYLPGIEIRKTNDYLSPDIKKDKVDGKCLGLEEFKLSGHFALPLETQAVLKEHDPISYLIGNMTQLASGELISFQIVTTPLISSTHKKDLKEMQILRRSIVKGQPLTPVLHRDFLQSVTSLPVISIVWSVIRVVWFITWKIFNFIMEAITILANDGRGSFQTGNTLSKVKPQEILNPYEQELSKIVKGKIDQDLFETSIRILVIADTENEVDLRLNGLMASFGQLNSSFQSLVTKHGLFIPGLQSRLQAFRNRTLSPQSIYFNPILSVSELSDLFHFPYTDTTKTEDLVKVYSKQLPAPLSVKNNSAFDVVFGRNTYANTDTVIGLTDDDRSRHVYIIGQTGSGKSTILYHMAKDDIGKGRGVAVIDPHGDLAEDLLTVVPSNRINDCIYFNPFDIRYPIGINLLELTPGLKDDELEQEKELVCESVVSVFRRIFSKDENTDAHRIEYILRNTIYTAFTIKDATIFTVYHLLNDPKYRKSIVSALDDENLQNFWTNEFDRAGNFQIVKMVSGVTARIGRFLFSPVAKRIMEQPKSTISFDEILSTQKILICNLSEGKLGEDTSQLLGTTIITKLQQAAMRRGRSEKNQRTPFYLFIDEFQNFATVSFTKLLSGGRKFGLRLTIAEQTTSQQEDRNVINAILANTGTVICFRTASPIDEQIMISQLAPYVTPDDIVNLPRYRFYIKLSAVEPEEPFSGETLPVNLDYDQRKVQKVIEASRANCAIKYKKPRSGVTRKISNRTRKTSKKERQKLVVNGFLPEEFEN